MDLSRDFFTYSNILEVSLWLVSITSCAESQIPSSSCHRLVFFQMWPLLHLKMKESRRPGSCHILYTSKGTNHDPPPRPPLSPVLTKHRRQSPAVCVFKHGLGPVHWHEVEATKSTVDLLLSLDEGVFNNTVTSVHPLSVLESSVLSNSD